MLCFPWPVHPHWRSFCQLVPGGWWTLSLRCSGELSHEFVLSCHLSVFLRSIFSSVPLKFLFARIFHLIIGRVLMLSGWVVQPTTLHSPELNLCMHIDPWLAVMKVEFISPGFLTPSLPSCPRKAFKEKIGLALYLLPVLKKKNLSLLINFCFWIGAP